LVSTDVFVQNLFADGDERFDFLERNPRVEEVKADVVNRFGSIG
jgi:hypothetical protein